MDGKTDWWTENQTPISHLAKAGATKMSKFLHDANDATARLWQYLDVFFENSQAKNRDLSLRRHVASLMQWCNHSATKTLTDPALNLLISFTTVLFYCIFRMRDQMGQYTPPPDYDNTSTFSSKTAKLKIEIWACVGMLHG